MSMFMATEHVLYELNGCFDKSATLSVKREQTNLLSYFSGSPLHHRVHTSNEENYTMEIDPAAALAKPAHEMAGSPISSSFIRKRSIKMVESPSPETCKILSFKASLSRKQTLASPLLGSHWTIKRHTTVLPKTSKGPSLATVSSTYSPPLSPLLVAPLKSKRTGSSKRALSQSASTNTLDKYLIPTAKDGQNERALSREKGGEDEMSLVWMDVVRDIQSEFMSTATSQTVIAAPSTRLAGLIQASEEGCQLPFAETGKDAFRRISAQTLVQLMNGDYDHMHEERYIIDCRFPYEYEGGHIVSAVNIHTMGEINRFFFDLPKFHKRVILVFHCEFSSHRAPTLAQYLRSQDRMHNLNRYPHLFYPEIYILKGGYHEFYQQYKPICVPSDYVQMTHADYKEDLRREWSSYRRSWKRNKSFSDVPSDCEDVCHA